jgi:ABC-type amino acid transport substrate-binding protein
MLSLTRVIPLGLLMTAGAVAQTAAPAPLRVVAYSVEPYIHVANGHPAGLEYDILEYIAKALGRPLEISWVERFEEVLPALEQGGFDVASATITITPERQARFAFSPAYLPVRVVLVEPSSENTSSLAALRGSTLATIKGTTYESLLLQVPEVKLLYAASEQEQFELVAGGRARALAVDSAVAFHQLKRFPGLRLGMPLGPEQGFGFAFPKGSTLAPAFSRTLHQLKASNIYYPLLKKHLGEEAVAAVKAAKAQ